MTKGDEKKITPPPFMFLRSDSEDERMNWSPSMACPEENLSTACPDCKRLNELRETTKHLMKIHQERCLKKAREHRRICERNANETGFGSTEQDVDRLLQQLRKCSRDADFIAQMSLILKGSSNRSGRQSKEERFYQ